MTRHGAEESAWDAYSDCSRIADPEVLTFQTRLATPWQDEAGV